MKVSWTWALAVAALAALAPRSGAEDFEFDVIGDTRPRFESESFKPFESLITKINALKPALVINLGDLIYGYGVPSKERQWDKYEAVLKNLHVPYYQLPGNHDTHSKEARKIYGRRFGKFYESFDYGGCHFVLLDSTENQRWGYIGPTQFQWLTNDLHATHAASVFVFLHFPIWEPERVTASSYEFWAEKLHPLFKQSRVRAVFGGHYHAYGPTREFDGIRYFITGGGGAELRPEYRRAGGEHHFMRVLVAGDGFDVRVVTERGELTDPDADVMGGLLFAAKNVSRVGIKAGTQDLKAGVPFSVSASNPYSDTMTGRAEWVFDASVFSVEPRSVTLQIPAGGTRQCDFTLRALQDTTSLHSLPRLEFNVVAGAKHHRFNREIRFLEELPTPYLARAPVLDGRLEDWSAGVPLTLGEEAEAAQFRACHDGRNLYLALSIPTPDEEAAEETGFSDEVQIGMARQLSAAEFGNDLLRFGLNSNTAQVWDRTPGRRSETALFGIARAVRVHGTRTTYEVSIPFRLLKRINTGPGQRCVVDLSFPLPDSASPEAEPPDPAVNSFSYRVRYGNDSLVPVYFVELNLAPKR